MPSLAFKDAKVAVIRSEIDPEIIIKEFRAGALRATGAGPDLDEDALRESTIVGQMGIHPLITALESGAQFILAGRSCDIALFASDMIRRNIDAGLAYHVGHVLECGALACDPGSPSDCLVAEIYDDGSAIFTAPNPARRCTAYSIAAHSLYEESHPQLQYYPEGILVMEKTQFFSRDGRSAGIRNSRFVHSAKPWPWSIKLEGSRQLGARKVSLIHIDPADLPKIPPDVLVYGRNGVQATAGRRIAARTRHHRRDERQDPGGRSAAGQPADALPDSLRLSRPKGDRRQYCLSAVAESDQLPARGRLVRRHRAERNARSCVLRELSRDQGRRAEADRGRIPGRACRMRPMRSPMRTLRIRSRCCAPSIAIPKGWRNVTGRRSTASRGSSSPARRSLLNLDAPDAYVWSLYHLLQNEDVIKNTMFPITYFTANGADWIEQGSERPRYFDIGETRLSRQCRRPDALADRGPCRRSAPPVGSHRLLDMAVVIRSKDAGINRLTFDIIFTSGENYEAALHSNVFARCNVAKILNLPPERVVGTFFVDSCNAIKISVDRPNISASMDERDVFGAQQQVAIEQMSIPIYPAALAKASSF